MPTDPLPVPAHEPLTYLNQLERLFQEVSIARAVWCSHPDADMDAVLAGILSAADERRDQSAPPAAPLPEGRKIGESMGLSENIIVVGTDPAPAASVGREPLETVWLLYETDEYCYGSEFVAGVYQSVRDAEAEGWRRARKRFRDGLATTWDAGRLTHTIHAGTEQRFIDHEWHIQEEPILAAPRADQEPG